MTRNKQAGGKRLPQKNAKSQKSAARPPKKGGFLAGLRASAPQTVQQSIPYREMYRDGICRVTDRYYTKTVQFFDINYQLAQAEDKTQIFESYCDFLNYFDSSIHVQLTFINQQANMQDFAQSIDIPTRGTSMTRSAASTAICSGVKCRKVTTASASANTSPSAWRPMTCAMPKCVWNALKQT